MRVARLCAGAALCLAALACDNQKSKGAGGPELYAPIAGDSAGGAQPAAKKEARRDTVVEGAAINEPEPLQPQAEVAVGMKRELFLATLGGCAERIAFAPARVEGLGGQLAPGGTLVSPVGAGSGQALLCLRKDARGALEESTLGPASFVPLLSGLVD